MDVFDPGALACAMLLACGGLAKSRRPPTNYGSPADEQLRGHARALARAPDGGAACRTSRSTRTMLACPTSAQPVARRARDAHCRYHFTPVPSPADVDLHLAEGRVAELEALLASRFEGHGREHHPDESVHRFFHAFTWGGGTPQGMEADRITQRWLELAPDSAFALVARATCGDAGPRLPAAAPGQGHHAGAFRLMMALFAQAVALPAALGSPRTSPTRTRPGFDREMASGWRRGASGDHPGHRGARLCGSRTRLHAAGTAVGRLVRSYAAFPGC